MSKRVRAGIFSGVFDPVHAGHLSFALQAMQTAHLDEVCFVPERKPSNHPEAEHFGHRVAMLRRALRPYPQFALAELVERELTVAKTLPQLRGLYPGAQLVLLMGAEVFVELPSWPHFERIVQNCEFVIHVRNHAEVSYVLHQMQQFAIPLRAVTMLDSTRPRLHSTAVQEAIRRGASAQWGVLPSVERYARQEWLYAHIQ